MWIGKHEGKELLDVVGNEPDIVQTSGLPVRGPSSGFLTEVRFGKGAWVLAVHVPHVCLTLIVGDSQVLLGINPDSVVASRVGTQTPLPVVLDLEDEGVTSRVV